MCSYISPSNDFILENIYRKTLAVLLETVHTQVGLAAEDVLAICTLDFRISHAKYARLVLHIHQAFGIGAPMEFQLSLPLSLCALLFTLKVRKAAASLNREVKRDECDRVSACSRCSNGDPSSDPPSLTLKLLERLKTELKSAFHGGMLAARA